MKCIVTRSSIINRCNSDGEIHFFMTEKEKPCDEAVLTEMLDKNGEKYKVDVLVTRNVEFDNYVAIVLYDEEINRNLY